MASLLSANPHQEIVFLEYSPLIDPCFISITPDRWCTELPERDPCPGALFILGAAMGFFEFFLYFVLGVRKKTDGDDSLLPLVGALRSAPRKRVPCSA